jgi:hypothetical protein
LLGILVMNIPWFVIWSASAFFNPTAGALTARITRCGTTVAVEIPVRADGMGVAIMTYWSSQPMRRLVRSVDSGMADAAPADRASAR